MIAFWAAPLPDEDPEIREDWARWQVEAVRRLVFEVAYEPPFFTIDGCNHEQSEELATGPEDQVPADSIGVYYSDGEEEEAARWAALCRTATEVLESIVDWAALRPSAVATRAARIGLHLRPAFVAEGRVRGVAMTNQEIDAMERKESDDCRLELARRPAGLSDLSGALNLPDRLIGSYTRFMVSDPPEGVTVRWLWGTSARWTQARTGKLAKAFAAWGLDFGDEQKEQALAFAEGWRSAFYTFATGVDWRRLHLDTLRNTATELGIIDEDA